MFTLIEMCFRTKNELERERESFFIMHLSLSVILIEFTNLMSR